MNLIKKNIRLAGVGLLIFTSSLCAQSPSAMDVLQKSFDYTGKMNKYSFSAAITDHSVDEFGKVKVFKYDTDVKVSRPDKLRVDVKSDFTNRSSFINDGQYTIVEHGHGFYGQLKVAKNIDDALDEVFTNFRIKAPLASLIYADMGKRLTFTKSKYFGKTQINGIEHDYISFRNKSKEIHVWISSNGVPLVSTYSIIDKSTKPHSRLDTVLTWNKSGDISPDDFIFTPTKDISKISIEAGK